MIRMARRDRIGRAALFVVWVGLIIPTYGIAAWYVSPSLEKLDLTL